MNTKEREQLNNFLSQLVAAHPGQKDAEAESLIRDAVARQPDAAYLLVQKAFLQEQAIVSAQNRIEQLQGEIDALRANQGRNAFTNSDAWGNSAPRMAPQPAVAAPAAPAQTPSWGSGWLGNVATTAAGVAAGAFLFQGIENLIGHHGNNGLFGGNALLQPSESTVINNFFENDSPALGSSGFDGLSDGLDNAGDNNWI